MSQPSQPINPKQNFLQTFLIATTMFLAFQFFFNRNPQNPDARTSKEILNNIQKLSLEKKESTAVQEFNLYKTKINNDPSLKETEKIEKVLEASMLVASTQLKVGETRKEVDLINNAYNILDSEERAHNQKTIWKNKTYLALDTTGKTLVATHPAELYQEISQKLQKNNKELKIWGFFPGYAFIDTLVKATGAHSWSYGFAALFLAIIVRAIVWPLAIKTTLHSKKMAQLTPLINELKEKYQAPELNIKIMELYKGYGMNPTSGCLPAVAQIPLFLIIFQAMNAYKFEFKHGTFLWINPHLSESTNGFLAPSLGEMDYILIGLYGISMIVTSLLNPNTDPTNMKQQKTTSIMVSLLFSVMMFFWPLPSAFVLYWIFANLLGIVQTIFMNRIPIPPLMKRVGANGELMPIAQLTNRSLFGRIGSPRSKKNRPKKG